MAASVHRSGIECFGNSVIRTLQHKYRSQSIRFNAKPLNCHLDATAFKKSPAIVYLRDEYTSSKSNKKKGQHTVDVKRRTGPVYLKYADLEELRAAADIVVKRSKKSEWQRFIRYPLNAFSYRRRESSWIWKAFRGGGISSGCSIYICKGDSHYLWRCYLSHPPPSVLKRFRRLNSHIWNCKIAYRRSSLRRSGTHLAQTSIRLLLAAGWCYTDSPDEDRQKADYDASGNFIGDEPGILYCYYILYFI
jgi:hypothetical protein